jgi:hypothetical protein
MLRDLLRAIGAGLILAMLALFILALLLRGNEPPPPPDPAYQVWRTMLV